MDPALPDLQIADVVASTAGRDMGKWFYVVNLDDTYLFLANGKDRRIENPKRKKRKTLQRSFALRPESPRNSSPVTKCSTANYEEIWLI